VWNAAFDVGLGAGALAVGAAASAGLGLAGTYVACVVGMLAAVPVAVAAAPSGTGREAGG
jgi:hypothetical protein